MALIKGILSFPTLFTPKVATGATEAKFNVGVLIPPNDPQIAVLQAEVEQAKVNGCPSGYNGQDECFGLYEVKIPPSKSYHDARFVGWYLFTSTAKAEDRPSVVDVNYNPIIDPGAVFSGMVGFVNAGISYYPKGKAGIGGWLNGVMITTMEPPMGRLDGKPTVEQMFADVSGGTPAAPAPSPVSPPPQAPQPQYVMTEKANGLTREQYLATPGWTDELLIKQSMMLPPAGVTPSFA